MLEEEFIRAGVKSEFETKKLVDVQNIFHKMCRYVLEFRQSTTMDEDLNIAELFALADQLTTDGIYDDAPKIEEAKQNSRYVTYSKSEEDEFIGLQRKKNTVKNTSTAVTQFSDYVRFASPLETRPLEEIPATELNDYLSSFFLGCSSFFKAFPVLLYFGAPYIPSISVRIYFRLPCNYWVEYVASAAICSGVSCANVSMSASRAAAAFRAAAAAGKGVE